MIGISILNMTSLALNLLTTGIGVLMSHNTHPAISIHVQPRNYIHLTVIYNKRQRQYTTSHFLAAIYLISMFQHLTLYTNMSHDSVATSDFSN